MQHTDPILTISGVGPSMADKLNGLGISTVGQLLDYMPRKYDDYSGATTISKMQPGLVTLNVSFENVSQRRVKRSLHITDADAVDDTGKVKVVWFNQPYRPASLKSGLKYSLQGTYDLKNNRLQIINPSLEQVSDLPKNQNIVATYPERAGIKSHQLRKIFSKLFTASLDIPELLPPDVVKNNQLPGIVWSYQQIHQPGSSDNLAIAKKRFAFEELFIVMLAAAQLKQQTTQVPALPIKFIEQTAKDFVAELPFDLTNSQRAVVWQIYKDMAKTVPMNRLIEGDVGSGKTVVAAMAVLMALEAGQQAAIIAPTSILANQHYQTIQSLLSHTKYAKSTKLLTGSLTAKQKTILKKDIQAGQADCLIGTHALLQQDINWSKLGLVVIDEQHRFGVNQRQALHNKSGHMPHILCLTATPIPRSLALTVYGELDISILNKPPAIKAGYQTSLISPNSTAQMYSAIKQQLAAGRQAYVVCPLITDSDLAKASSAEQVYKTLSQSELRQFRVGLLHGRLKSADKDQIMQDFKDHKLDVLVSTTVIEVGVDVKNATEMVILNADRFGLAQLHQLRGRVGRGEHLGHCYLVMTDSQAPSRRMKAIASTDDGFKLAELDLEIRGPGAIYGNRQHGELDLRHVSLTDSQLIATVRQAVDTFINSGENVLKYPKLSDRLNRTLKLTYLN